MPKVEIDSNDLLDIQLRANGFEELRKELKTYKDMLNPVNVNWKEYLPYIMFSEIKVGTLILTLQGKVYIVGDVNILFGCGDCCKEKDITHYSNYFVDLISTIKQKLTEKSKF